MTKKIAAFKETTTSTKTIDSINISIKTSCNHDFPGRYPATQLILCCSDGIEIPIKRKIINNHSPIFARNVDAYVQKINVGDFDSSVVTDVVDWMYGETIVFEEPKIYEFADKFCMEGLKEAYISYVIKHLSIDNIKEYQQFAEDYNLSEVKAFINQSKTKRTLNILEKDSISRIVLLCADGKKISVHRALLMYHSSIFKVMLSEKNLRKVDIVDFDSKVVQMAVEWMYRENMNFEDPAISYFASMYKLDELKKEYVSTMLEKLSISNNNTESCDTSHNDDDSHIQEASTNFSPVNLVMNFVRSL